MKRRIKKDIVLILLGVAIVAIPFLLRMKEQERSNRYMKAFEEEQNEEKQNKKDHKKKDSLLLQEGVIGIIEIPSLDIKYPVFEGAGSVQLNEGIGHMTNTTELCGKGNCVLAGHYRQPRDRRDCDFYGRDGARTARGAAPRILCQRFARAQDAAYLHHRLCRAHEGGHGSEGENAGVFRRYLPGVPPPDRSGRRYHPAFPTRRRNGELYKNAGRPVCAGWQRD